jgi:hypothetical protein
MPEDVYVEDNTPSRDPRKHVCNPEVCGIHYEPWCPMWKDAKGVLPPKEQPKRKPRGDNNG